MKAPYKIHERLALSRAAAITLRAPGSPVVEALDVEELNLAENLL
jgi:hypothetical protein